MVTQHATRNSFRLIKFIALIIVAVGFALRLYTLGSESLWYDELLQLDIAQGPLSILAARLRGHSAVPLDYVISHFWILLGRDDAWVRLPSVLVGTVTLPVAYQFGRALLGRVEGLLLMALLAVSPFHVHFSQQVRPYALIVLGVTLAGYAFWQLHLTGKWQYFVPLQIGVLVLSLAHIFAVVIFVPLGIYLVVDFIFSTNRKRVLHTAIALALTTLLPLLVYLLMGWGDVLYYTSLKFGGALVQPEQIAQGRDPQIESHLTPGVNWLFVRDTLLAPFSASSWLPWLLLFNALALLGFVWLLVWKNFRLALLLSVWLIVPPVLLVAFLVYRQTFFASRYIISVLPVYLLLLAVGLLAMPRWLEKAGQRGIAVGVFALLSGLTLLVSISGLSRMYSQNTNENWRLVSDFITNNAKSDDAIIAFHAEPVMNWYYPPAWAAPNFYPDLPTIQQHVAKNRRGWVILSIFSSDYDAQVKAWLSEQQAVRFPLDPMIHVYYLGAGIPHDELLVEIQDFALPADHQIYATLARENRRRPEVARRYFELALEYAPDADTQSEYRAALEDLAQ